MDFSFLNKKNDVIVFKTEQEAFVYFLAKYQEKGIEIDEAINKASEISEKYAQKMNLPKNTTPKEKGFKGILQDLQYGVSFLKENPQVVEYGKPLLTGLSALLGGFAGVKIADEPEPLPIAPIVYDEETETNTN